MGNPLGCAQCYEEFTEHVAGMIKAVVGEEFEDHASAATWWAENQENYDSAMGRK